MFKRNGFTILELMIVIAVIAIIVGIALPRFKGMQDEGNITKAKAELRTLQTAVESYYIHHNNTYPTSLTDLVAVANIPKVVAALPADPFNVGNNYGYGQSSNAQFYVIASAGPNGNGTATVSDAGVVTEANGTSCIFVTNGTTIDVQP